MTETIKKPYSWIKSISPALLQNDSIPLIGFPPSFPWEDFAQKLSQTFEIKDLKILHDAFQWRSQEELREGLGDHVLPLHFALSPLSGTFCWLFAQEDLTQIMALLLQTPAGSLASLNPDFQDGFYRFLAMECMDALRGLDFSKNLSPRLLDKTDLPQENSAQFLCMDVRLELNGHKILGRSVISSQLRNECKQHFSQQSWQEMLNLPHMQNLEILVHLEAGRTSIKYSEWEQIGVGDFLSLDFCSLRSNEGRILLTINHTPFFRAKLKDGHIKILEHPLYHEVGTPVDKNIKNSDDASAEDHFEEEEFEEESFEEEGFEEDFEEEDEESENSDSEYELEEESSLPSKNLEQNKKNSPEQEKTSLEQAPSTIEDITLSVIIEVGRLNMSVKQLMELQPGNLLESNIHPENGVNLIVNGKCIGKGELLLLGETLGVRILELG